MNRLSRAAAATLVVLGIWSCSTTKHVPEGSYLLDHAEIKVEGDKSVKPVQLVNYLRQTPNHSVLGGWKLQLNTYSLSGSDTTRWYNRWLRTMGQPPVIYSQPLTDASVRQLELALINRGYADAVVTSNTVSHPTKKKVDVVYTATTGIPHRIGSIAYDIPDAAMRRLVMADSARFGIKPGNLFDRDMLDAERMEITNRLRNNGYYAFTKDYITFMADTVLGKKEVDLTMVFAPPKAELLAAVAEEERADTLTHPVYYLRNVTFVTDYQLGQTLSQAVEAATDSVWFRGVEVLYGPDRWQAASTLEEKCFLEPGKPYDASKVDLTYEYLSRLEMVKSINIEMLQVGVDHDRRLLDAYILLTHGKKQGVTFEVEGTNSEGDLGFGVGLTYQHRNLAHRSRVLTAKFRASYESLSGNLDGLINNNYQEYSAEVGITFPKFAIPFVSSNIRKRVKASTEVAINGNYQARPEYTRVVVGGTWRYKWGNLSNRTRRTLDLLNINYVYLPRSTYDFLNEIAPTNPLLRYSYEDHFIMGIGYSFSHTNRRTTSLSARSAYVQPSIYTFRASVETAGNLLYGLSHLMGSDRDEGVYKIFGIQYSQYAKAEFEYSYLRNFTPRHGLAFRVGGGLAYPYGNSTAVPFEKRFYAGGANGVRGWGVRTLGPGSFDSNNSQSDFINQCGDISLIVSAEYRAKLFWVLEGGLFVDAGNIWTIHDYENQPGGVFRFNKFYKQIAGSYGAGLRFDFTYFLLRLDLGIKAYNPSANQVRWPIAHPNWHRDATIHFAVGYPF